MKPLKITISSIAVAGILSVPLMSWAESGSRTGDAAEFLEGTVCPPPEGAPCFDATAGGQKLSGTLSVVYDKVLDATCGTPQFPLPFAKNMYVNVTMQQGNLRVPFTADYLTGPPSHATGFCIDTNTPEQVNVMLALVRNRVIPYFYACTPGSQGNCPNFKVKAITNYQYTVGQPLTSNSGGFSADITIAVE